jgi:hypothetical protein
MQIASVFRGWRSHWGGGFRVPHQRLLVVRLGLTLPEKVDFESTASTISPNEQFVPLAHLRAN